VKTPQTPARHVSLGGYAAKQCFERLRKDLDPNYPEVWKDEVDPFTQAIMDAGNVYEQDVIRPAIMDAIPSHIVIDTTVKMGPKRMGEILTEARTKTLVVFDGTRDELSLVLRETLTHELLEEPGKVRVLWNPRLRKWRKDGNGKIVWSNRAAEPDVLYRQGSRVSTSARWSSIDVKFHHPFEGKRKGIEWECSTLASPFPEKASKEAWEGILKKEDAFQLAHYHRALEFHGLAGSAIAGIIGKPLDDEFKVVWLDLNEKLYERSTVSALSMYDDQFAEALSVASREMDRIDNPSLTSLSFPEWKSECKTCVWRSTCHDELSAQEHITLLPGITPDRAQEHYLAGVISVDALARLDVTTAAVIDAGVRDLEMLMDKANSGSFASTDPMSVLLEGRTAKKQLECLESAGMTTVGDVANLDPQTARYTTKVSHLVASIDQARVAESVRLGRGKVYRARGVDTLAIPRANVEIHVDMENDEHIYLWGVTVVWTENGRRRTTHKPFSSFEANDAAEAAVTVEFWNYLMGMIAKANERHGEGNVKVFHYTEAEDRCLRALAKKHAGMKGIPTSDEVEEFLASDVWVDLYPVLTKQLVWPTEDHSLKSLAKHISFEWRDDDPSGANSVVWYQRAIDPTCEERVENQERIVLYNEDDCKATAALLAWLQQYDSVNNLKKKLPSVEDLESLPRYKAQSSAPKSKAAAKR